MAKYVLSFVKGSSIYLVSDKNLSRRVLNYFTSEPCIVYPKSLVDFSGLPVFSPRTMSKAHEMGLSSASSLYKNDLYLTGDLPDIVDCCFGWFHRAKDFYRPLYFYNSSYIPDVSITDTRFIELVNGSWCERSFFELG